VHYQETFAACDHYKQLQVGPVHADLFRNNVMFKGEQVTGFFDFYFAGCDTWLFDVAVTVNDWCIDLATGVLDAAGAGGAASTPLAGAMARSLAVTATWHRPASQQGK